MKSFSSRPIFTLAIKNSHHFSFFSSFNHHHNPIANRRHEDESRNVRVSVWWDFENCNLPCNFNVCRVTQCVANAVRSNGIKGPIQITAFGDVMQISRANQEALSSTGINLIHVPSGGKNSADRSLLVDLMYWVTQNPPPAHIFLISGDRDFAGILHRLRMNNYNILLASTQNASSVLCSAATIMWQWSSLLKGENLSGRLFNYPPDGSYSSWYGHFKAPLEDPFAINEQSTCLLAEKSSELQPIPKAVVKQSSYLPVEKTSELPQDFKPRPIPKAVVKQIRQIVNSNPEGILMSQLRTEINKSMTIDSDLYGYKKFSHFMLAMPHVFKLRPGNDGQFLVCCVNSKFPDESVPFVDVEEKTSTGGYELQNENNTIEFLIEKPAMLVPEPIAIAQTHNKDKPNESSLPVNVQEVKVNAHTPKVKALFTNSKGTKKEKMQSVSSPPDNLQAKKEKASVINLLEWEKEEKLKGSFSEKQEVDKNVDLHELPHKNEVASTLSEIKESQPGSNEHTGYFGIFRRIWRKWFASGDTNSNEKNRHKVDEILIGGDTIEDKNMTVETVCPALFSPSSHEALIRRKIGGDTVEEENLAAGTVCSTLFSSLSHEALIDRKIGGDIEEKNLAAETVCPPPFSPSSHEALIDRKFSWSSDVVTNISSQGSSFSNQAMRDCKFQSSLESDNEMKKNIEEVDQKKVKSKDLGFLSKKSFWSELRSFIDTSHGSALIFQSRTRDQLGQNLQKHGPSVLRFLPEADLHHVVDLLISDNKWVQECDSPNAPFKLTRPSLKDIPSNHTPLSSNGLSQIFSDKKPTLRDLGEKKLQNPQTVILQSGPQRISSVKPRSEILNDCQKLLNHITEEYPEGFQLGGFKKLFLGKHGYVLDHEKIGYEKLVNLLQIMPGVRIESNLILPKKPFKNIGIQTMDVSNQERKVGGPVTDSFLDLSSKNGDNDSSWDELGPVNNSGAKKPKTLSDCLKKEQIIPDYELLREDEFSDSSEEEDASPFIKSEKELKTEKEDASSLLQVLDSWYSEKEEGYATKSDAQTTGIKLKNAIFPVENNVKKHSKPGKSFSFVTEDDGKDKIIDGILETFKK